MKKIYKYILFLMVMLVPLLVRADKIYNVDMHVNIDKTGTAHFEVIWDANASGGSEWYIGYENMGNIGLSNYKVYMDGKLLKEKPHWRLDDSRKEKAGYYGVHYLFDGFELCFGKGDLKKHIFTLKYDLSNMIFNTEDSQVLYFNFIPRITTNNYNVIIDSYYQFPNNLEVWGYGAKGYAYVNNGQIKMSNAGKVKNNYVTLLAKFPLETFDTINYDSRFSTFNDVLEMAEENTYEYDYDDEGYPLKDKVIAFLIVIFFSICFLIPFFVNTGTKSNKKFGFRGNKRITKKNTPLFREIPCNKDIYYANALVKLNDFNYKESNILGAILLKWVKEDKVTFVKGEKNNNKSTKIDMTKEFIYDENTIPNEEKLYKMMYKASKDGFLEPKEFEKWAKKNYSKFLKVLSNFSKYKIKELRNQGYIYRRFSKKECRQLNVMNDILYQDSKELYGLRLFLDEFTDVRSKEVIDVKLWDEYLMFAYLFGIADRVAKRFKNMYPKVANIEDVENYDYNIILFINDISISSVSAASMAKKEASSYSSSGAGGGGFSSGGGGGGSFGSGGSAGGR